MKDPLNQFAERIIRNGEVTEFIEGLIEKGVPPEQIVKAASPPPKPAESPWDEAGRYKFNT